MGYAFDAAAEHRLSAYFDEVGCALANKKRRAAFAVYALGLLSALDRKSIEPLAAVACADPDECDAWHQRLLHFSANAPWSDRAVRRIAARHAVEAMAKHERIRTWIIDDTGFLKKGVHSVGVQRQYTGSAGKVTNCQIAVTLSVATSRAHVPIDAELYLPKDWADDPVRREQAKIPDDVTFKTKTDLALDMIQRAVDDKVPGDIVLADGDYGRSHELRSTVRMLGFEYALGIHPLTSLFRLRRDERPMGVAKSARDIAHSLDERSFRRVVWRDGTRGPLQSRFAFVRVRVALEGQPDVVENEPLWLLIEWPEHEDAPTKYALTTLPRSMARKQIVRTLKERWRTEQAYQEMKTELGLDHFEGRSWVGWHHHVSLVICCYAFVVGERMRHFSPSAGRTRQHRAIVAAA
jgi:SRSO17 transposase